MSTSPDRHQDIARSRYADMLHDDERNRAYDAAIRMAVSTLVTSDKHNPSGGRFFYCCDIGAGSGLLSMMVVRAFLDLNYHSFHVSAYEEFQAMAECAIRNIAKNRMDEYITIIPRRSTECSRPKGELFDLLVAELLDTELIGEDCLTVYLLAIEKLCSPKCIFIPHKANVYIQPVASKRLFDRQTLHGVEVELRDKKKVIFKVADDIKNCPGFPEVDDMQVSQLNPGEDFTQITDSPRLAFSFIFNNARSLIIRETCLVEFVILAELNEPPVIIMWWEIIMYDTAIINFRHVKIPLDKLDKSLEVLSCAPSWARDKQMLERDKLVTELYKRNVWREHWIQGVYHLRNIKDARFLYCNKSLGTTTIQQPTTVTIIAHHHAHNMWFELDVGQSRRIAPYHPETCNCGMHRVLSRNEIGLLNDKKVMSQIMNSYFGCHLLKELESPINAELVLIDAAWRIATDPKWKIKFTPAKPSDSLSTVCSLIDMKLTDDVSYRCIMERIFHQPQELIITPYDGFVIKFTQVQFEDLQRIYLNVNECEGFDFKEFDVMINHSSGLADKSVESYNLWEYSSIRLDEEDYVIYSSEIHGVGSRESIEQGAYWKNFKLPLYQRGPAEWKKGWALVFWTEFKLANTNQVISTGPVRQGRIFEKIKWNHHFKQMVHFMQDYPGPRPCSGSNLKVSLDIGIDWTRLVFRKPPQ